MRKFFQTVKLAFEGVWAHKLRSFLSMIGVAVGVFSVIMLTSLGEGSKKQIEKEFTAFGTNLIFVAPGKIDTSRPQLFNPAQMLDVSALSEEDVKVIKKEVKGVKNASPVDVVGGVISYNKKPFPQAFALAVYPEFFSIMDKSLLEGRIFSEEEMNKKKLVCVIGMNVKEEFFKNESAVGKKIFIKNTPLTVVGVLDKSPVAFRMFGFDFDNVVYLPFSASHAINSRPPQIFRILVKTENEEKIQEVMEKIKVVLKDNHQGREDFSVLRQEDILNILDSVLNILITLISAIAGISLFVGGIGIMNIMLVSVNERIKEIGLRKALGAKKRDILFQFLTEAVLITLLGGIIGILGAFFLSQIIGKFTNFTPYITVKYIVLAVVVAFSVGVFFGTAPAIKAANLDPIEALRHE